MSGQWCTEGTEQTRDVQNEYKGEQEAEQQRSDLRSRRHGTDGLADSRVVQRGPYAEHEVRKASARVGEADGPIPAKEEQGSR